MEDTRKLYVLFDGEGKGLNLCYAVSETQARTMLQVQPGLSVRQVTNQEWVEIFKRDIMPCS